MLEVIKGTTTAALRTVYFEMLDETDHVTPIVDLTPAGTIIKSDESAFASIDGTVDHIANGVYQCVLDAADVDTAGCAMLRFTSAGADDRLVPIFVRDFKYAYNPLTSDVDDVSGSIGKHLVDEITNLINRLGAFTGTGVETVLGFLAAMADHAATKPTSLTNFTSARDALSKVGEKLQDVFDEVVPISSMSSLLASSTGDIFTGRLHYVADDVASQDEYTIVWLQNGLPSGYATINVYLTVYLRADGTKVIDHQAMTAISSTPANRAHKYNASGLERLAEGEAAIAEIVGVNDVGAVTYREIVCRAPAA